uniref:NADH-ubiquinone oxidoreductase chain 3 n=1 Tax=Bovicola bovis TaxID=160097 RepID=A0A386B263_9NEOP|nr:NADH dehydrogenase subunit 3 [Bovicola bovis]
MILVALVLCLVVLIALTLASSLFFLQEPQMGSSDPFECGLETTSSNRTPFHVHYFLVGVLFLIFDIEFVCSLPMAFYFDSISTWLTVWGAYFLLMFVGLLLEVSLGTIEWKK